MYSRIVEAMTVTVSVLGSGSRGNTTFIRTDGVRLLIDAGMSRREIGRRLEAIGEDPDGVDAVLITHEHNDHAGGLKGLLKDMRIQAHLTRGTIEALKAEEFEMDGSRIVPVTPGVPFKVGDADVYPYRVPHDAREPVAFTVTSGGVKISQLTDIGYVPDTVAEQLSNSQVLILESNHDLEMLRVGPYPWSLKQRLLSRHGHLSNTAVGKFMRERYDGKAGHVVLAHLSSRNNHPELARQEVARAMRHRGISGQTVTVTEQDHPTTPITL
jgi:phosphoribosyl 1,2-cyclic phosphodiesterase